MSLTALIALAAAARIVLNRGSNDETPAIRRAINAPFIDYEHGDAHALCEDLAPSVARRFAQNLSRAPTCEERVQRALALSRKGAPTTPSGAPPIDLTSAAIRRQGDRAEVYFNRNSRQIGMALERVGGRWRISTPAGLNPYCNYVAGRRSCNYGLWIGSA